VRIIETGITVFVRDPCWLGLPVHKKTDTMFSFTLLITCIAILQNRIF